MQHTVSIFSLFRSYGSTLSLLIKKLLDKDPESRPSADSLLSMAAVKQYSRRFEPKLLLKERRHSLPNIPAKSSVEEKEQKRSRVVSTDKENVHVQFCIFYNKFVQ